MYITPHEAAMLTRLRPQFYVDEHGEWLKRMDYFIYLSLCRRLMGLESLPELVEKLARPVFEASVFDLGPVHVVGFDSSQNGIPGYRVAEMLEGGSRLSTVRLPHEVMWQALSLDESFAVSWEQYGDGCV